MRAVLTKIDINTYPTHSLQECSLAIQTFTLSVHTQKDAISHFRHYMHVSMTFPILSYLKIIVKLQMIFLL